MFILERLGQECSIEIPLARAETGGATLKPAATRLYLSPSLSFSLPLPVFLPPLYLTVSITGSPGDDLEKVYRGETCVLQVPVFSFYTLTPSETRGTERERFN